jgi:hypothetical protein
MGGRCAGASIAIFATAAAWALASGGAAPLQAQEAAGAIGATSAQSEVRRRFVPRVRLVATLVNRGRTRVDELDVLGAPRGAVVEAACSGRGCPAGSGLAGVEGRRLGAGARLVVTTQVAREIRSSGGTSFPYQIEYTTTYVIRRGALPRRRDSCEANPAVIADCVDPAIVGLFRVQGPVTRVTRMRITEVELQDVFRVSCKGRSCPFGVGYHPLGSSVDFTAAFRGERLRPGTKITVAYIRPDTITLRVPGEQYLPPISCSATQWTIRRGAAPRRIDLGPQEGEDENAVREACSQPFPR